jgi:peptidoglycan/xylan/chitin deacetylase (PgdA/CDA1 family)
MKSIVAAVTAMLLASCATVPPTTSPAPEIAITVDDVPLQLPLPKGETPLSVARPIIAALKAEHVPAYGFLNGHWTEERPDTREVLQAWRAAGLALGNHGWSHRHLSEISPDEFEQELVRNEPLLRSGSKDWHWFRYPFLDEGWKTPKRTAARAILAKHGYKVAEVTMDFGDWMWTAPYARCSDAADKAALAKLEQLYMQAARESIGYFRQVSQSAYGRDIPYVLLLHISPFEARMLPRLLALYRQEGFRFVSLPQAEADPLYVKQVNPQLPPDTRDMEGIAMTKGPLPPRTDFAPILDGMCKA